MWAMEPWRSRLYTREAKSQEYLRQYASVFTTVEGNNTFYGLPKPDTVKRWHDDVPAHFRFCFKFPRLISHDVMLGGQIAEDETARFLKLLEPIQDRIGLLFLQLPPGFNAIQLDRLNAYLSDLPKHFHYCVEPRHADFFNHGDSEQAFDAILTSHAVNRSLFLTSTLHALTPSNDAIREAQRKKPSFPNRHTVTAEYPFVRYVGHETAEPNEAQLAALADRACSWIAEGRTPYLFVHTPGDAYVPELGRRLHELLQERLGIEHVSDMPPWPGETEPPKPSQLSLDF